MKKQPTKKEHDPSTKISLRGDFTKETLIIALTAAVNAPEHAIFYNPALYFAAPKKKAENAVNHWDARQTMGQADRDIPASDELPWDE